MDEPELEASRRALLKYYNSQTITHGGYIIALVIGILTATTNWTTFYGNNIVWNAFLLLLLYLLTMLAYVVLRTFVWGNLAYEVLDATPSQEEGRTVMFRLHLGTRNRVYKRSKILKLFLELSRKLKIGIFLIVPIILWFFYFSIILALKYL